ncbi:acyltransferase family protein [Cellulomonas massiliensis]|uniref:acyltransferase family protein n=1 Tax=Cellulomonas massiliensis TaxID=1465811 RepID=UPI00031C2F1F|nr:acyltransferase family protein [Cellulomonas massiliensis]
MTTTTPRGSTPADAVRTDVTPGAEHHRHRGPASAPGAASGRIRGLDGLRAWAVLAVVAYHLAPSSVPGGFIGVDVFFVVSGFLITTLLLREAADRGRISLPSFWLRRARRLLPALGLVVVTSLVAARLVSTDLLVGIGRQVLGAATFLTNWVEIAAGSSYFDATQPELFQPFWSLAIEEQFYVLWPVLLVLLLVLARSWRARAAVALGAALLSALLMAVLHQPDGDPTRVYYGTDTHAFGLLLGVAAAFAWRGGLVLPLRPRLARWLPASALGLLTVLVVVLQDQATVTYRGGLLLASVLAVLAVAGCTTGESAYVRALETRPLTWVGERSYGLYLWHWPVILVVGAVVVAAPGTAAWWWGTALSLVVTFALAAASYRWLEVPVRRDGFRAVAARARAAVVREPGARVLAGAAAVVLVLAVVAVAGAPAKSQAQLAVEQGERAQAEQGRQATQPAATPSAGAGAAAPGAQDPGEGTTGRPVTGADVVAFGDSVLSAAAPAVYDALPGVAIDAKPIRKWVDAPAVVEAAAKEGRLRPVVVLAFGTNGGFQFPGSEKAVESIMRTLGDERQVVFVNLTGISYWVPDANQQLASIVERYPNAHLVDWAAKVHGHPQWLHPDKTHPNMAGIVVYAELLEKALGRLTTAG